MSVLTLALTGSVLLVVDVVLGRVEGVIAGSAMLLVCGGLWGLLPQLVRQHGPRPELPWDRQPERTRWAPGATSDARRAEPRCRP